MKKYLFALIMLASPLMAQENRKELIEYKRPVFGLNFDLGYAFNGLSFSALTTGISTDFYLGNKHKVYFFLQFNLGYQYYSNFPAGDYFLLTPAISTFYFGAYIGMGGYIFEANQNNPWSIIMNGGVGGALLFRKVALGDGYNNTSIGLGGEGVGVYLDLLARYHVNNNYAVQFGPAMNFTFMFPSPTVEVTFKVGFAF
ncbi:MAG: hypothetical protein ACRCTJ_06620 [Brevinema sp.]